MFDPTKLQTVMNKPHDAVLTADELAEALYEGTPHLQNLAEKLARQHGEAGALCFFSMQSEYVKDFYRSIAEQLIAHASHWQENEGCACVLDQQERDHLIKRMHRRKQERHRREQQQKPEATDADH